MEMSDLYAACPRGFFSTYLISAAVLPLHDELHSEMMTLFEWVTHDWNPCIGFLNSFI